MTDTVTIPSALADKAARLIEPLGKAGTFLTDQEWSSEVFEAADLLAEIVTALRHRIATTRPDALRTSLQRWRDNLAITRGDPVAGDYLHGPALDFVIEQLDGFLARAALASEDARQPQQPKD